MIYEIAYNVVLMDGDTIVDVIDGGFETIEFARECLKLAIKIDNKKYTPEDRGIFKIEKITRELVE